MPSAASLANLRAPWQPGESGNAGRTPNGYRRTLAVARNASPEAMEAAVTCMRDNSASWRERLAAIAMILDRAWGRPREHVQIDGDGIASLRIVFVEPSETTPTPAPTIDGVASQTRDVSQTSEAQPDPDAFQVAFAEPEDEAT